MAFLPAKPTFALVALLAIIYQLVIRDLLFTTLGYGRFVLRLEQFEGVRCEKAEGVGLQACEDMWFHEPSGLLYLACSDPVSRMDWLPSYVLQHIFFAIRVNLSCYLLYLT